MFCQQQYLFLFIVNVHAFFIGNIIYNSCWEFQDKTTLEAFILFVIQFNSYQNYFYNNLSMSRTQENFYEDSNILTLSDYSEQRISVEKINYNNSNDVIHKRLSLEKIQKNLEKAQQIYQAIEKYFKITNPNLQIQKHMISGVAMADSHYILPLIHAIQKNNQTLRNTIYNFDNKRSMDSVHLFTDDFTCKTLEFEQEKNIGLGSKLFGGTFQHCQVQETIEKKQYESQRKQKYENNNKIVNILEKLSKNKHSCQNQRENSLKRDNSIQFTYNSKQKKQNRSLRKRQWMTMLEKNRKCKDKVNSIKNQLNQVKNQLGMNSTNSRENKDRLKRQKFSEGSINITNKILSKKKQTEYKKVQKNYQNKQNLYVNNHSEISKNPNIRHELDKPIVNDNQLKDLLTQNQSLMDEFNKKSLRFAQFLSEFQKEKQNKIINDKSIMFEIPFLNINNQQTKHEEPDRSMFKNIKNSNSYISINKLQTSLSPFERSRNRQQQLNNTFCSIKPTEVQRKQASRLNTPINQLFNNMPITKSYTSLSAQPPSLNSPFRNTVIRKISIFEPLQKTHNIPSIPLPQKITSLRPLSSTTYEKPYRKINSEKTFNRSSSGGSIRKGITLLSKRNINW